MTYSQDFDLRRELFSHQLVTDVGLFVGNVVNQRRELLDDFVLFSGLSLGDGSKSPGQQHNAVVRKTT